jgi:ABC-type multidrug transport system ATPase subunit
VTRPARGVGWAPQRPAVYPRLTTRENLAFFCALEGPDATDERVAELLARADLQEYADKRTDALSTGTVQRLNLAIAICGAPAVLLLDEPTATLSPDQRLRLWEWIESMRAQDGLAVVFSTQSVDEARDHGDRLVVIAAGAQVFDGTYDGLAAEGAGDAERGFLRLIESA